MCCRCCGLDVEVNRLIAAGTNPDSGRDRLHPEG
jgi:hypothetical protein